MWSFGEYAEKRIGKILFLSNIDHAKIFESKKEAKEWAGTSLDEFDIIRIKSQGAAKSPRQPQQPQK